MKIKIALFILAILFGIFMFIYGGYDDSPGAQFLGFIVFTIGVRGLLKRNRFFKIK